MLPLPLLQLPSSCLLPGDLESAPILRSISSDGCVYELDWYTAAACVLSKTQGNNCKVEDAQAGTKQTLECDQRGFWSEQYFTWAKRTLTSFCRSADLSFDLSPLTKTDGGFYNLTIGNYDYYINVCGPVKAVNCPDKAGACQVEQRQSVATNMWAGTHIHFCQNTAS